MKAYHEQHGHRYIVIGKSYSKDTVLGLTTNKILIVVGKENRRIDEFVCPDSLWDLYESQIDDLERVPEWQLCLYFGEPYIGTDEDL